MQENNSKMNLKKIFKKGNRTFKLSLGFLETTKEKGHEILSKIKECGKDTGLYFIGFIGYFFILIKKIGLFFGQQGKNIWANIKNAFYTTLGILVALFCVSLFLFCIFIIINRINPTFITNLHSQFILNYDEYNSQVVTKTINQLITEGKVINASEIYNHMLEYYNTIITILIALLGVFGAISWFTIQGKANYEVKTTIDNKFESTKFKENLVEKINKQINEMIDKDYWDQIISKHKEEIVSCILKDEQIKKLIESEKDDVLNSHKSDVQKLDGVEDGDEI